MLDLSPSDPIIKNYLRDIQRLEQQQITHELGIRGPFQNLLDKAARRRGWTLVPELSTHSGGKRVVPDGTVRDEFRLERGWWEAKDTSDKLAAEIEKNRKAGYPTINTIFEDSRTAVLYQDRAEAGEYALREPVLIANLLNGFFSHDESTKMKRSKDKTSIRVNDSLTLAGIPPETFEYRLGSKSALDWIIDQYQLKAESDPNRDEDPGYIVRLLGQIVRVSVETVQIVNRLPGFMPDAIV